ncbi:MAG TPA: ABC transporter ATP-binding protein, partial [Acidimicrobiales bacterium]|nr:ABC transporter ATP-binding protein [Acidimicrobiales bacterium]
MVDAVRLRSVVALAGRFPLLAGADLTARPGQVVLLRGPNGAGKTSLLRVCAGLLAVTSGQAVVLGEDLLADRRGIRRRVGLLGHATHLYDDLTVAENVRFFLRAAGLPGEAAPPALARLALTGRLADLPASRLSAGLRRRAALAVIAARDPELWLLDEPHAGLDADGRALVDELVAAAA